MKTQIVPSMLLSETLPPKPSKHNIMYYLKKRVGS